MKLFKQIIILAILSFFVPLLMASDSQQQSLEVHIKKLEVEFYTEKSDYEENIDIINKQIIEIKEQEKTLDSLQSNLKELHRQLEEIKTVKTNTNNKDKQVSDKIGESEDDVPCTCVFNKNRMWNPEKIVWNNYEWQCEIYNDDGTCAKVERLK